VPWVSEGRQIDRTKKALNVEDEASLQKTREYLEGVSAASQA
jgi:hypothetical protein